MILLVDRGNTRTKWRLISNQRLISEAIDSDAFVKLKQFLGTDTSVQRVFVACVAGEVILNRIQKALGEIFSSEVVDVVRAVEGFEGFYPAYENISTMGVDRWLQLLAVYRLGVYPAWVVSLGTAVTADKLDLTGKHIGGLIAPGWKMLSGVVQGSTALIDVDLPEKPKPGDLGATTGECLYSGVSRMLVAYLEILDRDFAGDAQAKIVCGGDAESVISYLPGYQLKEGLVLDGLAVIADKVREYKLCLQKQ